MKTYSWDIPKAYKCLNLSTHKVIESAHVQSDDFVEESKENVEKKLKNT